MPITFAPPQTVAPEIAQAYGAAQVSNQNIPVLGNLYESAARLASQRNQADADRAAQYQSRNLDRMQAGAEIVRQDENQRQNRELGYQEFYARQQASPAELSRLQANQQQQQQQQDAVLADWLRQRGLSQQDAIQKQNLDQAVSWVMENKDGYLTPEMKKAALIQLKGKLDPITQREILKEDKEQKQIEANQTQAERALKGDYSGMKFVPDPTDPSKPYIDPNDPSKLPMILVPDPKGNAQVDLFEKPRAAAQERLKLQMKNDHEKELLVLKEKLAAAANALKEAAQANRPKPVLDEQGRTPQMYQKAKEKIVNDYAKAEGDKVTAGKPTKSADELKKNIEDSLAQYGYKPTIEEHFQGQDLWQTNGGRGAGGYTAAGGTQPEAQQPQARPFDPMDPKTQPPDVAVVVNNILDHVRSIPTPDVENRSRASGIANQLLGMMRSGVPIEQRPVAEQRQMAALTESLWAINEQATGKKPEVKKVEWDATQRERLVKFLEARDKAGSLTRSGISRPLTQEELKARADKLIEKNPNLSPSNFESQFPPQ